MKKFFIALSVLAVLGLGAGSALAVPGTPDNVPGCDFVAPFLVSTDRVSLTGVLGSGPTTALDFTEVRGFGTDVHLYFYDVQSNLVHSTWLYLTNWQSAMKDIGVYISLMSDAERARLITTVNGVDQFAGYIWGINWVWRLVQATPGGPWVLTRVRGVFNNLIGSIYQLDLSSGLAAAAHLPMKEFYNVSQADLTLQQTGINWAATDPQLARWAITGYDYLPYWGLGGLMPVVFTKVSPLLTDTINAWENWTPVALAAATDLVWGNPITTTAYRATNAVGAVTTTWNAPSAAWFRLLPEYYILDATGETTFVLWQNGLPNGSTFHFFVVNRNENYVDTSITVNELTFIDARDTVPDGLKICYPYQGIFNMTMDDTGATATDVMWTEMLGWSWQYANDGGGSAATNWSVLKEMARDVGTVGVMPVPRHVQPAVPPCPWP